MPARHARVLEVVAKSRSPLQSQGFKRHVAENAAKPLYPFQQSGVAAQHRNRPDPFMEGGSTL
jgi:hypothetical protein